MEKDLTYHESAIKYNDVLAEAAEQLAQDVPDPTVKKWCSSIGRQHRFHAKRHRSALEKMQKDDESLEKELSLQEEQARFAAQQEELEQRAEADAELVDAGAEKEN